MQGHLCNIQEFNQMEKKIKQLEVELQAKTEEHEIC